MLPTVPPYESELAIANRVFNLIPNGFSHLSIIINSQTSQAFVYTRVLKEILTIKQGLQIFVAKQAALQSLVFLVPIILTVLVNLTCHKRL